MTGGPAWVSLAEATKAYLHPEPFWIAFCIHPNLDWPFRRTRIDGIYYVINHDTHTVLCRYGVKTPDDLIEKLNTEYWDNINKETS
jgi:hypothetical protein